jgi:MFS family permease
LNQPRRFAAQLLLRHPDFARFVLGRLCTNLGWQMLGVAVGWQVYALTRDPLALGYVGLWEFLPFVSLVLLGGHTADHANRRRIIVVTAFTETLCVATLLWFTFSGLRHPWPIYLAIAVFGGTRAFWMPSMQALMVNLVPRADLPDAAAVDSLLRQVATVTGPALGGVLYLVGAPVVYLSCMAAFLVTASMMLMIRTATPAAQTGVGPLRGRTHELLAGLHFVARNRALLGVISLDLFAVLFGGAVALLPVFAADVLHTGPAGLGLLRTAPAVGAAVVGAMLAIRPIREHAGAWMFGGVAVFGLATIAFGLSTSFLLSLAALAIAGAGDMVSVYVRTVLVQLHTPENIRGRVSAVNAMFIGASNELGAFESGATARWFGTVPSVVAGGVATLAVVAGWALIFPQLRRVPPLR